MELDKACNNLKNVEQICSSMSNVEQLDSRIDNFTEIAVRYAWVDTDSIEIDVDNTNKTISANIVQNQYNSRQEFPSVGSNRILYVDLSDNSIWRYDTVLEDYVQIGKVGTAVTVGGDFVEDLDFDSNPQEQINAIKSDMPRMIILDGGA